MISSLAADEGNSYHERRRNGASIGDFRQPAGWLVQRGNSAGGQEWRLTDDDREVRYAPIPLYNEDVHQQGFPLRSRISANIKGADGILILRQSITIRSPGVLKNSIDWASRPPEQPFDGKPIGLMGRARGVFVTGRAPYHLRQCFVYLNGLVMNRPEVMIPAAQTKFDARVS